MILLKSTEQEIKCGLRKKEQKQLAGKLLGMNRQGGDGEGVNHYCTLPSESVFMR